MESVERLMSVRFLEKLDDAVGKIRLDVGGSCIILLVIAVEV